MVNMVRVKLCLFLALALFSLVSASYNEIDNEIDPTVRGYGYGYEDSYGRACGGDSCIGNEICVGRKYYGRWHKRCVYPRYVGISGFCARHLGLLCSGSLQCRHQTCVQICGVGESCNGSSRICEYDATCTDNICESNDKKTDTAKELPSPSISATPSTSASPSASASPPTTPPTVATESVSKKRTLPVALASSVTSRQSAPEETGSVKSDPSVYTFDFSGRSFIGQQVIVTVAGIRGDYDESTESVALYINQDSDSPLELTGIGLEGLPTQCTDDLLPPTRPSDPSTTATIIDLGEGKLGITVKPVSALSESECADISEVEVTATTISQVEGESVSPSPTASVSASASITITPYPIHTDVVTPSESPEIEEESLEPFPTITDTHSSNPTETPEIEEVSPEPSSTIIAPPSSIPAETPYIIEEESPEPSAPEASVSPGFTDGVLITVTPYVDPEDTVAP